MYWGVYRGSGWFGDDTSATLGASVMVRGFLVVPALPKVRQVEMTGGLIQPIGFVLMMGLIVVLGWDGMVFKGCS